MSTKQTAILRTSTIATVAILIGMATSATLMFLTIAQIGILFCVVGLAILVKLVYDVELSRAEHLDTLNKISESLPKS